MGDVKYTQIKSENILSRKTIPPDTVCEDCGSKWTAMLIDIPVSVFINDLDEYSRMLSKNMLGAPDPPLVLYVFRPSDKELMDTKITLSCVVPSQSFPLQWIITHNATGLRAPKGCQLMPKKCETPSDIFEDINSGFQPDVTIKEEEIKIENQKDLSYTSEIENFNSSQIEDYSKDSHSNTNIAGNELIHFSNTLQPESPSNQTNLANPAGASSTKLTLQQAQQMGLISPSKTITHSSNKIVVQHVGITGPTPAKSPIGIKMLVPVSMALKSGIIKSSTKIVPARTPQTQQILNHQILSGGSLRGGSIMSSPQKIVSKNNVPQPGQIHKQATEIRNVDNIATSSWDPTINPIKIPPLDKINSFPVAAQTPTVLPIIPAVSSTTYTPLATAHTLLPTTAAAASTAISTISSEAPKYQNIKKRPREIIENDEESSVTGLSSIEPTASCSTDLTQNVNYSENREGKVPKNKGPSRFHNSTIQELQSVREKCTEGTTKDQTKWGIGVFKLWLEERQQSSDFELLPPPEINDLLATFYLEARQVNGQPYSKSGLRCIRSSVQRYLQGEPWNRTLLITKDSEFVRSNEVLSGIIKVMTAEGRDRTKHHNAVDPNDMKLLSHTGVIGTNTPKSLQNLVWLSTALHFAKRGFQGWRGMTKTTLVHGVDDQGEQFLEYRNSVKQKNHPGYRPEARMYARPGNPLCPVSAYNLYMSHLWPELDVLWQRPNPNWRPDGRSWYCKSALGVQTLDKMMKMMSKEANLSRIYTNHCLRTTASVGLAEAGHERSDICVVTGHKSARSLDPYINRRSDAKKRKLSANIGNIISEDKGPAESLDIIDLDNDCELVVPLSALSQVTSEAEEVDLSHGVLEAEDIDDPLPTSNTHS